jgi:hypothetical protein
MNTEWACALATEPNHVVILVIFTSGFICEGKAVLLESAYDTDLDSCIPTDLAHFCDKRLTMFLKLPWMEKSQICNYLIKFYF